MRKILPSILAFSLFGDQIAVSAGVSPSPADRISKSAETVAKKRLSAYVLARYGNAAAPTRERFAKNYEAVSGTDPSAEIHPFYLVSLEKTLLASPLKEDGALFGAYVHVLLSLRDGKADVAKMVEERIASLPKALREATVGNVRPKNASERERAFAVFSKLGYDPWSSKNLAEMRKNIEEKRIGPNTPYFQAFAFARRELVNRSGNLSLATKIPHEKQRWNLSCEANSLRDLLNYYRIGKGEAPVEESSFVFLLPADASAPKYENGVRIWADPDKTFVGRVDGRQSANPSKLTGYGIHASGVLPYLKNELKRYGLEAQKRGFDSDAIRNSLAMGNPVVFWYVLGADSPKGVSRLEWKTPEGKSVTGFVGQHVGVIVGAKIGNDGKIEEASYYEGRTDSLQKESFESLSRKAKWFNEAIYVVEAEKKKT